MAHPSRLKLDGPINARIAGPRMSAPASEATAAIERARPKQAKGAMVQKRSGRAEATVVRPLEKMGRQIWLAAHWARAARGVCTEWMEDKTQDRLGMQYDGKPVPPG